MVSFLVLTFAITWTTWITANAMAGPANTGLFAVGGPVFLLGVFAPALVALAMTARNEGREGVRRLLGRIGHWRVPVRFYAFAVGYSVATKLGGAIIQRMTIGVWPPFGDEPWILMLGAILISTWVQAGEEIGWRGYALPRLSESVGLSAASVLLGVIWAVWHLPLFVLPNTGMGGQSFPFYVSHVTAVSIAMAWVYWKTDGSLLLVMLMHASINNTIEFIPARVPGAQDSWSFNASFVGWATVAVAWLIALPLLAWMRRVRLLSR